MTTKAGKEYKTRLLKHFVSEDWKTALAPEFSKAYFNKLCDSLAQEESSGAEVFPPIEHIFEAFNFTTPDQIKAVILGQDPYHDNGQAHGLCFSVQPGVKVPPSLRNMYTELEEDIEDFSRPTHGYLLSWAKQGVLMFNATMTVQAHKANSHKSLGWLTFTDAVIDYLNAKQKNVVFALWGGFAQKKGAKIDPKKHAVLKSAHPSPLSVAKWKGSRAFSKINEKLTEFGKEPINWSLPEDPKLELPEGMPESEGVSASTDDAADAAIDEQDTPSPSSDNEAETEMTEQRTITEDFSRLKLTELRALCREQGVSPSGKKADVVSRLQNIQAGLPVPALGKRKRTTSTSRSPSKSKKPAKAKVVEEDTDSDSPDSDETMKEEKATPAKATTDGFDEPQKSDPKELKIVSWNVAGWKAVLKKGFEDYANKEQADIICLQETKIDPVLVPSDILPGYQKFFSIGDKKGYAGTGIFSKVAPISTTLGIQIDEHDNEGRVITAEYETFYLVTTYIPNSGRKLVRLEYRMQWDKDFFAYLKKLDKTKPVIWCGDLNVSHLEIDIANPKGNKRNAGFTDEERKSFGGFLADGFTDIYRKMYPDEKDCYTYWTYVKDARSRNVGWRLDYFIVSDRFVPNVSAYFRRSSVLGSDHCPIGIIVKP